MATTEEAFRRIGENINRGLEACPFSMDQVAERSLMETGEIELVIAGQDLDVTGDALNCLAGAIGIESADIFEGVHWVPHGDRPGGEYFIASD